MIVVISSVSVIDLYSKNLKIEVTWKKRINIKLTKQWKPGL